MASRGRAAPYCVRVLEVDPQPVRRRPPLWLTGSAVIAASIVVMNLGTYGFTVLAARILGPREYGVLASLMGLLLVLNVLSLGLQATAARRVAAAPGQRAAVERDVLAASRRAAVALGLVALAASPVVTVVLHFDSPWEAVLLAVGSVPLTLMGAQAGLLQGDRRWGPLAAVYLAVGLGRLGLGLLGMLLLEDATGAMLGVAAGNVVPTLVGWWLLRRRPAHPAPDPEGVSSSAPTPSPGDARAPGARSVAREVLHNSHALLAFFAVANADVIAARITLGERDAGLYAGGVILAKAVLFLPQFVVVIAFPDMASRAAGRLHMGGLAVVGAIGLAAAGAAAALPSVTVAFVGGAQYTALAGSVWAFAVLGGVLAMLQVLVYDVVARQHRRSVWLLWLALAVVGASVPFLDRLRSLLLTVITVDVLVLLVLLAVGLRRPASVRPLASVET